MSSKCKQMSTGRGKIFLIVSVILNAILFAYIARDKKDAILYSFELSDVKPNKDYYCVASWGTCVDKLVDSCDVAFIGNSITRGADFGSVFPDKKVVELGYAGDDVIGTANRIYQLNMVNPKKVFIMAGVNDCKTSLKAFERRYNILIDSLKTHIPDSAIYIQNILPVTNGKTIVPSNDKLIEMNEIIKSICKKNNLVYIDLHSLYYTNGEMPFDLTKDGLHLKPHAYERWVKRIAEYM